jgi:hypothetical protein
MSNINFSFVLNRQISTQIFQKQLPDLDFDLSLVAFSKLVFTSENWGKIK